MLQQIDQQSLRVSIKTFRMVAAQESQVCECHGTRTMSFPPTSTTLVSKNRQAKTIVTHVEHGQRLAKLIGRENNHILRSHTQGSNKNMGKDGRTMAGNGICFPGHQACSLQGSGRHLVLQEPEIPHGNLVQIEFEEVVLMNPFHILEHNGMAGHSRCRIKKTVCSQPS